jgi:hypothetical protein
MAMARDVQYIIITVRAVPFCTSTAIGTALETITQSHEIPYHSCDLLGWVVLMGMVLPEFCLPF